MDDEPSSIEETIERIQAEIKRVGSATYMSLKVSDIRQVTDMLVQVRDFVLSSER